MLLKSCRREEKFCDVELSMYMQSGEPQILTMTEMITEYLLSLRINFSRKQMQAECLYWSVADPLNNTRNL